MECAFTYNKKIDLVIQQRCCGHQATSIGVFMQDKMVLLPIPRIINYPGGSCTLADFSSILIDWENLGSLSFILDCLLTAFDTTMHKKLGLRTGQASKSDRLTISLHLSHQVHIPFQGYHLGIASDHIEIEASQASGLFYGVCTFIQIISQAAEVNKTGSEPPVLSIPCMEIQDWPDFENRGVMLDISRDKVPTMQTILEFVDLLSSWKINQLQLYTEHTFAYQAHPGVWTDASPLTATEIRELDAYCQQRFIELVPNQNSFGHMEHWLIYPEYRYLAEIPASLEITKGYSGRPSCLCPEDPGSFELIRSLYDELLPNFSSHQVNVGCDETFEVGRGRSKVACDRVGVGRVYLNYLLGIYHELTSQGYRMQFWADMVLKDPQLIPDLPTDITALIWGYEANHPFEEQAEYLAKNGIPFYVCPGTSSWNSIAGRTENCLNNLKNAAINGLKFGASGYLITDWGDNGHWQVLPVSYLGLAAGAAYAWSNDSNRTLDVQVVLSKFAFQDNSGWMGKIAYNLGNLYKETDMLLDNTSALFEILQEPMDNWIAKYDPIQAKVRFSHIQDLIEHASGILLQSSSRRRDNPLLVREFQLTMKLLHHSCNRVIRAFQSESASKNAMAVDLDQIINEYQAIWLSRNRPGGLQDSLSYFETAKKEYQ
jgi:hexosaminidase